MFALIVIVSPKKMKKIAVDLVRSLTSTTKILLFVCPNIIRIRMNDVEMRIKF